MGCQVSTDVQKFQESSDIKGFKLSPKPSSANQHENGGSIIKTEKESKNQLSEEEAATIIQSSYRGFKTRKETPKVKSMDANEVELEKAATKIQATFKGYKVRKDVKKDDEKQADTEAATAAAGEEEEPIDIDLNDPSVEKAATKIQATFRGYKTRKEIKDE